MLDFLKNMCYSVSINNKKVIDKKNYFKKLLKNA